MREGLAREQWESFLPFKVQGKLPDGKQVVAYDAAAQATLGFTLFFSMMSSIFGIGNILEEKESGTWNRLLRSSHGKTQIYLGNLAYIYLVGLLQTGLLLLAGYYLFGVDVFGVDIGENLGITLQEKT